MKNKPGHGGEGHCSLTPMSSTVCSVRVVCVFSGDTAYEMHSRPSTLPRTSHVIPSYLVFHSAAPQTLWLLLSVWAPGFALIPLMLPALSFTHLFCIL